MTIFGFKVTDPWISGNCFEIVGRTKYSNRDKYQVAQSIKFINYYAKLT